MNAVTKIKPDAVEPEVVTDPLALLRAPFPPHQISKLPKPNKKQNDELKADFTKGRRCTICGGWHQADVVHLDYVGHAALTDRLLDADPHWDWQPLAFSPEGLPAFDRNGGLWIKLTVSDMTRIGYGAADGKTGGDAVKEIIGDALRNAAMRFGAALDLWHKGDLHADEPEADAPSPEARAIAHLTSCSVDKGSFKDAWEKNKEGWKQHLDGPTYARVVKAMQELAAKFPKDEPKAAAASEEMPSDDEIPY